VSKDFRFSKSFSSSVIFSSLLLSTPLLVCFLVNQPHYHRFFGNVADEWVILFSHCEINFAGVQNAEVRPAISTDPNPNPIPNRMLSLLEMAINNIICSSATLPHFFSFLFS